MRWVWQMMRSHRSRIATAALVAAALAVVPIGTPSRAASAAERCADPPAVVPIEELVPGTFAKGSTVVQGREPSPFRVKILGIQPGGIAPGLALILVRASGTAVRKAGGIASGFSGSPIWIEDRLVGAVAYGFWSGDPRIGGLTPGAAIVELFGYPRSSTTSGDAFAPAAAEKVPLADRVRRTAARAAGMATADFPTSLRRLALPLGVSGLNDRGFAALEERIREQNLPFIPYRGSAASVPTDDSLLGEPLGPGDAVAAVYSYGDVTYAGVGTVTATCGDRIVAFGHPMAFRGSKIPLGMNAAQVVTTVRDTSQVTRPFKVATVAEPVGTVDQDRLAGIRGLVGRLPPLVPVKTTTVNEDLGRERTGSTHVARRDDWLAWIAWEHVWMNIDVIYDEIGPGMLTMDWQIRGLRESGDPFTVTRHNMYWSDWDVSWDSTIEFYSQLYRLIENRFEDVSLASVDVTQSVSGDRRALRLVRLRSASERQPAMKVRGRLKVRPGERIRLEAVLEPVHGGGLQTAELAMRIPKRARRSGYVRLDGGSTRWWVQAASFEKLIRRMQEGERNCDLVLRYWTRGMNRQKKILFTQDSLIDAEESLSLRLVVIR